MCVVNGPRLMIMDVLVMPGASGTVVYDYGILHPAELQFLERVSDIFGFAPDEFLRIRASHVGPDLADPYTILGVDRRASEDEVKRTYRMLVRENHPDSLIARGVPEEFVRLANDKLAAINGAYDRIIRERRVGAE